MDFYQEKITTIHDFSTDDGAVVSQIGR
ncbi:MAG: hypothetical protein PWQ44_769, partial [Methanolobus sp.]|nr:hypothetical protein [Methanolobus sp.]